MQQVYAGETVRIGYLQYGTVHWELDVIKHHQLFDHKDVSLEFVPAASHNALNVMLQGGRVDLIVGDWLWVSRQRNVGREFTSFPYSLAEGEIFVQGENPVKSLKELKGRELGVAGGETNKNWLIARAYTMQKMGVDLAEWVSPRFVAPPLLNQLLLRGQIDAGLNFWHYSAQLQSAGLKPLLSVDDMLKALSVDHSVPLLVWIFKEDWAEKNQQSLNAFLDASYRAKRIMHDSDDEWDRLEPLMRVKDESALPFIRKKYRAGIPYAFGKPERQAANKLYTLLIKLAGTKLLGSEDDLNEGTFFTGYQLGS